MDKLLSRADIEAKGFKLKDYRGIWQSKFSKYVFVKCRCGKFIHTPFTQEVIIAFCHWCKHTLNLKVIKNG